MIDPSSIIQCFCDLVAGGPDQLYAAPERRLITLGRGKSGKNGMMDLDDSLPENPRQTEQTEPA
jgi:hypothetical protein